MYALRPGYQVSYGLLNAPEEIPSRYGRIECYSLMQVFIETKE